ncbi:MAG: hypothetical protein P4L84_26925 [Isosphaeraceae bacterium]|nr:hypothetical protein [Isosphaeraceae bacterium]
MSPKNSFLRAGLSALGLFGIAVSGIADPPASNPPDQASSAAPVSESEDAVLLMSDGKVFRGKVSETAKGYLLKQKGNSLPLRRETVQGIFHTLDEAYRFQADHVPARDPDEQMKLARWCMTNNLTAEAKIHLKVVAALSPKSPAKRMLEGIELAEARLTPKDTEIQRAGAEVPREMNLGATKPARRIGLSAPPQIFDLPQGLAVRRANDFAIYVQPVLQRTCAGCHNETYAGEFQLIQIRSKHDRTPEVFRMNLDATLRLVDPENPGKSELLSSSLRPHGNGPRKRPIFLGSNDPDYRVLSTWVNSLKSPQANGGGIAAGGGTRPPVEGETFAADRGANRNPGFAEDAPLTIRPTGTPAVLSAPPQQMPPKRYVQGQGFVTETGPPSEGEFPVPFAVGGAAPLKVNAPQTAPPAGSPPAELPNLPATSIPPPVPVPGTTGAAKGAPKTPRTPVKIDETLLQQVLQNRNAPR